MLDINPLLILFNPPSPFFIGMTDRKYVKLIVLFLRLRSILGLASNLNRKTSRVDVADPEDR